MANLQKGRCVARNVLDQSETAVRHGSSQNAEETTPVLAIWHPESNRGGPINSVIARSPIHHYDSFSSPEDIPGLLSFPLKHFQQSLLNSLQICWPVQLKTKAITRCSSVLYVPEGWAGLYVCSKGATTSAALYSKLHLDMKLAQVGLETPKSEIWCKASEAALSELTCRQGREPSCRLSQADLLLALPQTPLLWWSSSFSMSGRLSAGQALRCSRSCLARLYLDLGCLPKLY